METNIIQKKKTIVEEPTIESVPDIAPSTENKPVINKLLINRYIIIVIAVIVIFLLFYFNIIPSIIPIKLNFSNVKKNKKSADDIDINDKWDINNEISKFMNLQDEYIQSFMK
jgi:hypothetical protein